MILDPAPARADLPAELFEVDYLSPNASEAEVLTGLPMPNIHAASAVAAELTARGARNVVLKLGSAGSMIAGVGTQVLHVRPYRVDVVDTTGAGDAFTGALAVALAGGQELPRAARFANAAGALATTRLGAQAAMPTGQEVLALMADQPT